MTQAEADELSKAGFVERIITTQTFFKVVDYVLRQHEDVDIADDLAYALELVLQKG